MSQQPSTSVLGIDSPAMAAEAAASLANVADKIGGSHAAPFAGDMHLSHDDAAMTAVPAAMDVDLATGTIAEAVSKVSPETMRAAAGAGMQLMATEAKGSAEARIAPPLDPQTLLSGLQDTIRGLESYTALLVGSKHIADVQLAFLEELSDSFFTRYEAALRDGKDASEAAAAHRNFLQALDQVMFSLSSLGLAGVPIAYETESSNEATAPLVPKKEPAEQQGIAEARDLTDLTMGEAGTTTATARATEPLLARTVAASQDAFERRERVRESASIVMSILGRAR